jgi:acyl-homoserine-lactone acylase
VETLQPSTSMIQPVCRTQRSIAAVLLAVALGACASTGPGATVPALPDLARQVEIRRTEHGVPHILAENLQAAAFALAWVQLEDHGEVVIRGMQSARGRLALVEGEARVAADARARERHARAVDAFPLLAQDTRDVYAGFAEGMNHYIRVHRARLPAWMQPDFTPQDVLSRDIIWPTDGSLDSFRRHVLSDSTGARVVVPVGDGAAVRAGHEEPPQEADNVGSNAFALTPERTTSGHAILLRNPHLAWTAGYYEAHVRVPGKLDFYGDFRIGGPFTVIGGFNAELGFATTNNASRSHEYYAFRLHPTQRDQYVLDGSPRPLLREEVAVEYVTPTGGIATATRELWSTEFGPVVHRSDSLVYIYRPARLGEYRAGEQWLEMMKARSLDEWKQAMRIGARTTSNFTYADRAGNAFYVWVAAAPRLPHVPGGDTVAILATGRGDVWQELVPFDALPQLHNPPGGYVRNENDSPHFTNLHRILPDTFSFEVESPSLRLRSQHGLMLLHNDRKFSLEDVVETKHSMRMLLAERVKADLLAAVAASRPTDEVARALSLLERWDNTAAADSRGGVLFEVWWNRYRSLLGGVEPHAVPWRADEPVGTPHGLADAARAAEAFGWAVAETVRRHGAVDVAWGDVHRVRRGDVDVPVGGCSGALGCYRVLNFTTAEDGRRVVNGGDGWVLAVEFGAEPRAYSVLAYGQSPDPASPYHDTQAVMFAQNRMKRVHWSEADIEAATVRWYHPGAVDR